jgi:hypothetical protein
MSTEAAVAVSLEEQVKALKNEVLQLTSEVHTLQRQQSSRRGPEGPIGQPGIEGRPGRDMVLRVVTDAKENVIRVFDEAGNEKGSIVAIPGPRGADAAPARNGVDGRPGRDGKDAPSLDEIVKAVIAEVKTRL